MSESKKLGFGFKGKKLIFPVDEDRFKKDEVRKQLLEEIYSIVNNENLASKYSVEQNEDLKNKFLSYLKSLRVLKVRGDSFSEKDSFDLLFKIITDSAVAIKELVVAKEENIEEKKRKIVTKFFDREFLSLIENIKFQLRFPQEVFEQIFEEVNGSLLREINSKFSTYLSVTEISEKEERRKLIKDFNQEIFHYNREIEACEWMVFTIPVFFKAGYEIVRTELEKKTSFIDNLTISTLPITLNSLTWRSDEEFQEFCYKFILKALFISSRKTIFNLAEKVAPRFLFYKDTNSENYVEHFIRTKDCKYKLFSSVNSHDKLAYGFSFEISSNSLEGVFLKSSMKNPMILNSIIRDEAFFDIGYLSENKWEKIYFTPFLLTSRMNTLASRPSYFHLPFFKHTITRINDSSLVEILDEFLSKFFSISKFLSKIELAREDWEEYLYFKFLLFSYKSETDFSENGKHADLRLLLEGNSKEEQSKLFESIVAENQKCETIYISLLLGEISKRNISLSESHFITEASKEDQRFILDLIPKP